MEFLRRLSSTRDGDIELADLEAGERSSHISPLPPGSFNSQIGVSGGPANTSTYPTLPEPDAVSSGMVYAMQIESLSLAEVGTQSDMNEKRSGYWSQPAADTNKVRIVPQTSRIPTVVSVSYQ